MTKLTQCQEDLKRVRAERDAIEMDHHAALDRITDLEQQLADCQATEPTGHPWRPYADTSIWNTPVADRSFVIAEDSDALVAQLKADKQGQGFTADDQWSHPVYWAKDTDPAKTINLIQAWGQTTQGMSCRIPSYALPERGSDHHLAVIQPDGWEYDFWKVAGPINPNTITAEFGGRTRIDGDALGAKATALGHGLAAGNITGEELAVGEIRHALFMVSAHSNGKQMNGAWSKGSVAPGPYPAMGQRFQYLASDEELNRGDWQSVVKRAMRVYGLIHADTGGGWLKGESPLPYTTVGKPAPLQEFGKQLGVGNSFRLELDWTRMRALI